MPNDVLGFYELTISIVLATTAIATAIEWWKRDFGNNRKFDRDWSRLGITLAVSLIAVAYIGLVFNWDLVVLTEHKLNETGQYLLRTGILLWGSMTILHALNGNVNRFLDNLIERVAAWIWRS